MAKSRWHVLTGGFSSGKSAMAEHLRKLGFLAVPDQARAIIDEGLREGHPATETRKDERAFQREVFFRKRGTEKALDRGQLLFLDAALPCAIAYHILHDMDPRDVINACEPGLYEKVFFLEQLPYERDYARTEDSSVIEPLNRLVREAYSGLGYKLIDIPAAASPEERVKLILPHVCLLE